MSGKNKKVKGPLRLEAIIPIIIVGVLLAFLIGPWLVTFIAGEEYSRAGEVIGWLALGQGFQGMYLMVTNYIFYSKKTGMLSVVSLSTGLLNLILLIFLVKVLGGELVVQI